jgi:hypothetical protein
VDGAAEIPAATKYLITSRHGAFSFEIHGDERTRVGAVCTQTQTSNGRSHTLRGRDRHDRQRERVCVCEMVPAENGVVLADDDGDDVCRFTEQWVELA